MNEIKAILSVMDTYGVTFVTTAIIMYFGFRYANIKLNAYQEEQSLRILKEQGCDGPELKDLRCHHFFAQVNQHIHINLKYADFGTEGRTAIFRDMLTIKFSVLAANLLLLIQSEVGDSEELYQKNLHLMRETENQYLRQWKMEGIPDAVINGFCKWHLPRVDYIYRELSFIKDSRILDELPEQMEAILQVYSATLSMTIIDGERTLNNLNGDITGLIYKDLII